MTYVEKIFRDLDKSYASKVRVGNEAWVDVKSKGAININTPKGTKTSLNFICVKPKPKLAWCWTIDGKEI